VVFPDETLRSIAVQRPASREGLARIPGLGPGRLDRYGAAVLALCAEPSAPAGADDKRAGADDKPAGADDKKAGSRA